MVTDYQIQSEPAMIESEAEESAVEQACLFAPTVLTICAIAFALWFASAFHIPSKQQFVLQQMKPYNEPTQTRQVAQPLVDTRIR
jgi:hypothetical protein